MNIGMYKRPRLGTLFTTLFVIGIMAAASLLSKPALWIAGPVFLVGVLSIYLTARSKEQVVVYVEKKNDRTNENVSVQDTQLDDDAIRKVIGDPQLVLNEICNRLNAGQGGIYVDDNNELNLAYRYALSHNTTASYKPGEGLVGRVASEGKTLYLDELPEGYITVFSGLGNASPRRLALIPIRSGVIEIATFTDINTSTLKHIEELCSEILK